MNFGNIFKIILRIQKISYGGGLHLYGIPIIAKNRTAVITIGENCHIRSGFLSNLVGLSQRSIVCARGTGKITIGNGVGMSGVTIYARDSICIGHHCIIGGNVKILDNDFHPVDPEVRLKTPCDNCAKRPITIGNNVFIGCNSLILKGSTIGDNSVIGAGSVVCGTIPPNCVAAGNPAKVVKKLEEKKYAPINDSNSDIQ